ncbi:MAG TPA: hypothetical protein VFS89_07810 [Nitrosospira sp.]|nr:hypothetical protein [Nitrosospira sp.]
MSINPKQFSLTLVLWLIAYGISFNGIMPISLAEDMNKKESESDSLFISCSPEKPVVFPNESIQLKAWVATSDGKPFPEELAYVWSVSAGNIRGKTAEARWDFENSKPGNYVAIVLATTVNKEAECSLQVVVEPSKPDEGPLVVESRGRRETGRSFLLPQQKEHEAYGLYSYLLLGGPPSDNSRERYLKVIETFLMVLPDIARLERHFAPSELNITYLPIDAAPPNITDVKLLAKWVLDHYDYARARYFLSQFSGNNRNGPYLVSVLAPLGGPTPLSHSLFQDLSAVPPRLARSWINEFMNQAAQEHFWETESLPQLRLKARSAIAILSMALPEVRNSLDSYIKLGSSLSP